MRLHDLNRLRARLDRLYGARADACMDRIQRLLEHYAPLLPKPPRHLWDERDVVLITYGDQVQAAGERPLQTLHRFLQESGIEGLINTVHLLPFYPFSSDDGFSVIDYRAVDDRLGNWSDVRRLGDDFRLMFDLVLNHCSRHSHWFQEYLRGKSPYDRFFIEADPAVDLSSVTRPRSLPLLTQFETAAGIRHLWTTFSADQVDLNFANPDVLVEMSDILLSYVRQGARIIRLDAVAYLWKTPGTSCIHLPQTHEVVKFYRDLLESVAPGVLILTETNVPHAENISYFGGGDEAHMVYQFSLPPLLLDAFLNQDARPMMTWLRKSTDTPPDTTFFNFTASHDGVGVRPLEGLVSPDRIERLVEATKKRGGLVSTKRNTDGSDAPYELNISYFDALGDPSDPNPERHVRRFLSSQAIMLALRGMPAIYFHSLVGTPNDLTGVQESGHARRINRRKYSLDELMSVIQAPTSTGAGVFAGYRDMLRVRTAQSAFHPAGTQEALPVETPWLSAFLRTSPDERQRILVLTNLSADTQQVDLARVSRFRFDQDLLANSPLPADRTVRLAPYQTVWLSS